MPIPIISEDPTIGPDDEHHGHIYRYDYPGDAAFIRETENDKGAVEGVELR